MTHRCYGNDGEILPELIERAKERVANGETQRSAAVGTIDGFCGFTMEFAPSPTYHSDTWDALETALSLPF